MANTFTKLNLGPAVASSGGRRFRKLSAFLEQLPPPYGLTLDGDYLTWGDYSVLATSFDILVDGVVKGTTTNTSAYLPDFVPGLGVYNVAVISKAEGYADSEPSESVGYVLGSGGSNE